jgi:UDPglucose 6-dehydrogenase
VKEVMATKETMSILGAGYVGLTTAACFAKMGMRVIVSDVDAPRIERLNRGLCPIVEDGLPELIAEGISNGRLSFICDNDEAVSNSSLVFLCLPTPQGLDGVADTSYVENASRQMATQLKPGTVVVTKSTVPVGSASVIQNALGRTDVSVVSNPEFLREGNAIYDFLHPDRIVIGANDINAAYRVGELYKSLGARIIFTDPSSAETIKYAANAFLATKISFINAVAAVCEGVGADVLDVIEGIGSDRRIGEAFLKPGPGWGGSCFPKDTKALVKIAESAGYDFALLKGVVEVNEQQLERIVGKVLSFRPSMTTGFRVCALGLTFKAGTDDRRDSPAISIIQRLLSLGIEVHAYDPTVSTSVIAGDLAGVVLYDSAKDAIQYTDVILVLTEWPEFKSLDPVKVAELIRSRNIVDARNLLDADLWRASGFTHIGVGR